MLRKLAGLQEGSRKSIQETGLNTLYLAFGMLEWYESDQTDRNFLSPLLLYPVSLERKLHNGQYFYTIKSFSEDIEENFSLRERLRQDYGIILPTFTQLSDDNDQVEDSPELYFEKVKDIIRVYSRWKVRSFLTLSLFSFGGIALFNDLNPERWPNEASILKHPLVSSILCGQEEANQDVIALDYNVDHPSIASKVPLLITDADASQFSAIVDAIDSKNLVIEGPPGTGKSQTITNLIAAALAVGKKVLFVSEKKAALEVVYNRLTNAGLENYCLEVHSTATSRQSFYSRLKRRVEQDQPPDMSLELADQVIECSQLKQLLSQYVLLLNQPLGRIGKTFQELLWSAKRADDLAADISLPPTLSSLRDDQASSMTDADLHRKYQHLKEFSQQHQELVKLYSNVESHPWFGLTAYNLSPIEQGDLIGIIKSWSNTLIRLQICSRRAIETLDIGEQSTLAELIHLNKQLESYPQINNAVEESLLPALKTTQEQNSASTLICQLMTYRKGVESLRQYFQDEIISLPDFTQLNALAVNLEELKIDSTEEYTIEQLQDLSKKATELASKIEQYKSLVTQIASCINSNSFLTPSELKSVSIAVQILSEQKPETLERRTAELCSQSSHDILINAQKTVEKLRLSQEELRRKYHIDACKDPERMCFYANKLRYANLLSYWFDPEYNKAKKLWERIQKYPSLLSDTKIANIFEKIGSFKRELDSFLNDSVLRRVCGKYFMGLETDFSSLLAVNSFAANVKKSLDSLPLGQHLSRILLEADITKARKILQLHFMQRFQLLIQFIDASRLDKKFDKQLTWEELSDHYRKISSQSAHAYKELISLGLNPLMPISLLPSLIQNIEELNSEKQR
ncbi:MAG: DUF4011 domain-containing protein [Synechococcaceae cyanobacterium SM2_3_1]|nr:DUF4011 domain-containing protein [Synechococcaceae cyanobacterium SM2_3_1]